MLFALESSDVIDDISIFTSYKDFLFDTGFKFQLL